MMNTLHHLLCYEKKYDEHFTSSTLLIEHCNIDTRRITVVMKVETKMIASIADSPTERAVMVYVEIFKTDVIVFNCNLIMYLTSH
jgi:hypothetical protein